MATKQTLYGRLMVIFSGGTQIDNLSSNGLKQTRAVRNVTTKDSNDNNESQPTIKSRTIDFKAIASPNSAANITLLQNAFDNGTIAVWKFGSGLSGVPYWSASGYITGLNFDAAHDGNLEIDGTVELTGVLTFGND